MVGGLASELGKSIDKHVFRLIKNPQLQSIAK